MSLTLVTFPANSTISASTMYTRLQQVELYVNEQIAQADRAAAWMVSNHIYRPDFYGGINSHTTLVSGESYFRQRPTDVPQQSWWSHYLGSSSTGYFPIPGLNATIQIPEDINTTGGHKVKVFASFYAYEFGGADGDIDETTSLGMAFNLLVNGASQSMLKPVYKGSSTSTSQSVAFYPRKQVSFVRALNLNEGVHDIGIGIWPTTPTGNLTKHSIVVQGNIIVRYYCR